MKTTLVVLIPLLLAGCVLFTADRCYHVITVPSSAASDWDRSGVCRRAAETVALQCGLAKTDEGDTITLGYVVSYYHRRTETVVLIFPEQRCIQVSQLYCHNPDLLERIKSTILEELAKTYPQGEVMVESGRDRAPVRTLSPI